MYPLGGNRGRKGKTEFNMSILRPNPEKTPNIRNNFFDDLMKSNPKLAF
jgi:hypothetical protein